MKKVIIIGCPGSGKSTFSRALSAICGIPVYHLDMMYWNADKTSVPREIFINDLCKVMEAPLWIIDGNYASTMEMRIKECDTVVFLDYPTQVCLEGVRSRKGKKRSDMPWVDNDSADEEFIEFINNYNSKSRPCVMKLLEQYSEKNIIVFRDRSESERFLSDLKDIMHNTAHEKIKYTTKTECDF